jgi:hypothetical protein
LDEKTLSFAQVDDGYDLGVEDRLRLHDERVIARFILDAALRSAGFAAPPELANPSPGTIMKRDGAPAWVRPWRISFSAAALKVIRIMVGLAPDFDADAAAFDVPLAVLEDGGSRRMAAGNEGLDHSIADGIDSASRCLRFCCWH